MNVLASLFIIAKNWKQLRCLAFGKWINTFLTFNFFER